MSTTGERPAAPEEVLGLEAIARRLHTSPETIVRWYTTAGFPMFRRRHDGRWTWVAHETSIALWKAARSSNESPGDNGND